MRTTNEANVKKAFREAEAELQRAVDCKGTQWRRRTWSRTMDDALIQSADEESAGEARIAGCSMGRGRTCIERRTAQPPAARHPERKWTSHVCVGLLALAADTLQAAGLQ